MLCISFAWTGNSQTPSASVKPPANMRQIMRGILLPNSNTIFDVQKTAPANAEGWDAVANSAILIAESASLAVAPQRRLSSGKLAPVGRSDWRKFAAALKTAGSACYEAALAKDQKRVASCTDQLADACSQCHEVYQDGEQASKP